VFLPLPEPLHHHHTSCFCPFFLEHISDMYLFVTHITIVWMFGISRHYHVAKTFCSLYSWWFESCSVCSDEVLVK
jgi:hypothetical protein